MESNTYPGSYYQPLFDLLNKEHGITPLESEMTDIIEVVEKMRKAQPSPRWVKASKRLPNNPDDPLIHYRLHGRKVNGNFYQDDDGMMFFEVRGSTHEPYQIGWKSFQYLEWLDEQPAAVSQDAHEKEIMMQAFDKVRQIFEGRQWVMDGRGSYPYNDDRYKEEVRYMYDEFDKVTKDTWGNIKSKSIEYKEWIIAEYLQKDHPAIHDILRRLGYQASPATEREEVKIPVTIALFEFVRDCAENWDHDSDAHRHDTICRKCDAKELYKCLKEQKEKAATLTQSRADLIREANGRDLDGMVKATDTVALKMVNINEVEKLKQWAIDRQTKGDRLMSALRSLRLSVTAHPDYTGEENAEWTDLVESSDEAIMDWLEREDQKEEWRRFMPGGLPALNQPILNDDDMKEGEREVKPAAPAIDIQPGLDFKNVHMPDHLFTVHKVFPEDNKVWVWIAPTATGGACWMERDWNLEHTQWAFEKGEYFIEKEVNNG